MDDKTRSNGRQDDLQVWRNIQSSKETKGQGEQVKNRTEKCKVGFNEHQKLETFNILIQ